MQVLVRPAAAADIEDAFLWYEQQRPGLGADFLRTVDGALAAIQSSPPDDRALTPIFLLQAK